MCGIVKCWSLAPRDSHNDLNRLVGSSRNVDDATADVRAQIEVEATCCERGRKAFSAWESIGVIELG